MSKPYDATTKRLIEMRPQDWVSLLGLPTGPVRLVDADLSTVSLAADRLIQVESSEPYLLHLELESGKDNSLLPRRLLRYNVNAEVKQDLNVLSAVVLLRPEADSPTLTGTLTRTRPDGSIYHWFEYTVIRTWQLDPEALLQGGLSTLPLVPISNVSAHTLPSLIARMDSRISSESKTDTETNDLWAATYVLMGLRYNKAFNAQLLQGVRRMRESVTYQAILEEGREEGVLLEARRMVLRTGIRRLGPIPSVAEAKIASVSKVETLEAIHDRIFDVETWDELLKEL